MRNSRLILGLRSVGLNTDNFYTNLTDLILQKMGFENYKDKLLRAWYEDTLHILIDTELQHYIFHERELAEQMYRLLEEKRALTKKYSHPLTLWMQWANVFKWRWRGI